MIDPSNGQHAAPGASQAAKAAARLHGPIATHVTSRSGQPDRTMERTLETVASVVEAIGRGRYSVVGHGLHGFHVTIADDEARLPYITVGTVLPIAEMDIDASSLPEVVARTLAPENLGDRAASHRELALRCMVKAILDGRVAVRPDASWLGIASLPTPWSPACIESKDSALEVPPFRCGPEGDALPTECRLIASEWKETGEAQPAWRLVRQVESFRAEDMPDAMETLRVARILRDEAKAAKEREDRWTMRSPRRRASKPAARP
jgi:hypothetical protein